MPDETHAIPLGSVIGGPDAPHLGYQEDGSPRTAVDPEAGSRQGLMPQGSDWRHPVCRDWETVPCQARGCRYNDAFKGECLTPSIARIGEDGHCTGFAPKA